MILLAALDWHAFFFTLFALLTCGFALAVLFSQNIVRMAFYLVLSLGASAGLFFLAGAEFVGAMQLMIYVGGTLVLLVFGVMLTAQSRFISMKTRSGEWVMALIVGGSLLFLLMTVAVSVQDWITPHPYPELVESLSDLESASAQAERIKQRASESNPLNARAAARLSRRVNKISSTLAGVTDVRVDDIAELAGQVAATEEVAAKLQSHLNSAQPTLSETSELADELQSSLGETTSQVAQLAKQLEIPLVASKSTTQIGLGFTGVRVDKLGQPDARLRTGMSGYLLPFVIVSVHLLVVLVGAAYLARTKKSATSTGTVA